MPVSGVQEESNEYSLGTPSNNPNNIPPDSKSTDISRSEKLHSRNNAIDANDPEL